MTEPLIYPIIINIDLLITKFLNVNVSYFSIQQTLQKKSIYLLQELQIHASCSPKLFQLLMKSNLKL